MNSKLTKTKKMLIEVARELFAGKGKDNVTMNDIAEASKRGRRTLYTYFNNKEEIYRQVIRQELRHLWDEINKAQDKSLPADIRLRNHIITHLDAVKFIVKRNGSLTADFFRDIFEVERVRKQIDVQEIEIIRKMLEQGIEERVFKRMEIDLGAVIIFHMIKGLEVPYIRQNLTAQFEAHKYEVMDFIFSGINRIPAAESTKKTRS